MPSEAPLQLALWQRLRRRSEFPLLITGGVLVLLLILELVFILIWDGALGQAVMAGMLAEIITGREGGIPVAIAGGVPPLLVWQISVLQDTAFWCLAFPWFLIFYHERAKRPELGFIMRRLRRMERAAKRHEAFAKKWGPLGIFLFMLTPFLLNGPMVGGILGRLVGIRTRFLVAPVVGATAVASAAWVFFYDATVDRLSAIDPRFGYAIASSLFVVFLVLGIIGLIIDEKRHRKSKRNDEGSA